MDKPRMIAVASLDDKGLAGEVSGHFGRCPFYTLVLIQDTVISDAKSVPNPHFQRHIPGVMPMFIRDLGADVILAGGMGPRAISMFESYGIEVVTGALGTVSKVLEAYLRGEQTGIVPCQHDHPQSCGAHGNQKPTGSEHA